MSYGLRGKGGWVTKGSLQNAQGSFFVSLRQSKIPAYPPLPRPNLSHMGTYLRLDFLLDPKQFFPPGHVFQPKFYTGTIMISSNT